MLFISSTKKFLIQRIFALVRLALIEIFPEELLFMLCIFFRTEQSHTLSLTMGLTNLCIVNPFVCLAALQCSACGTLTCACTGSN